MFSVLPAVDLTHGRLGAYSPEGPVPVEAFGGDPLAAARSFVEAGARWLHVVDMDLAFEGTVTNAGTSSRSARRSPTWRSRRVAASARRRRLPRSCRPAPPAS